MRRTMLGLEEDAETGRGGDVERELLWVRGWRRGGCKGKSCMEEEGGKGWGGVDGGRWEVEGGRWKAEGGRRKVEGRGRVGVGELGEQIPTWGHDGSCWEGCSRFRMRPMSSSDLVFARVLVVAFVLVARFPLGA